MAETGRLIVCNGCSFVFGEQDGGDNACPVCGKVNSDADDFECHNSTPDGDCCGGCMM